MGNVVHQAGLLKSYTLLFFTLAIFSELETLFNTTAVRVYLNYIVVMSILLEQWTYITKWEVIFDILRKIST